MKSLDVFCDFCTRPFSAQKWNCRTCISCAVSGAPDQSKDDWVTYMAKLRAYRLEMARKKDKKSLGART